MEMGIDMNDAVRERERGNVNGKWELIILGKSEV